MSSPVVLRRVLVLLLAVAVAGAVAGCFRRRAMAPPPMPPAATVPSLPPLEESQVDYPTFRAGYQTRLLRTGPAPQDWKPVPVADGAREIEYASGGRTLKAWVNEAATRPGAKKPAVLWLHGGYAFALEDWNQTEAFRKAGFHVLVPILRGENGQEGDFSLFANELEDALAAGDALQLLPGVDPDNLFVAGHEAGGTLALLVALSTDRFRAAAPISALPDCTRVVTSRADLAVFDVNVPAELLLRSPVAFAAFLRCPVRAYYGSSELTHVELDNQRLAERARAAGLDAETVRVPGGILGCVPPATELAARFFAEHRTKAE